MSKARDLTQKITASTSQLIGDDLIKATALVSLGFTANIKTQESADLVASAWMTIGKVEVTKVCEDIDVEDENGELIDILDGEFLYHNVFVNVRDGGKVN